MNIITDILPFYIFLLAFAPAINLLALYFVLRRKAKFQDPKQAVLEFVRILFGYAIYTALILDIIFQYMDFLWFTAVYVVLLVLWYLTERMIRAKYGIQE